MRKIQFQAFEILLPTDINFGDIASLTTNCVLTGDLLIRHGPLLSSFHAAIKDALLPLLKSSRMAVRKRANTAIGHLVSDISQ